MHIQLGFNGSISKITTEYNPYNQKRVTYFLIIMKNRWLYCILYPYNRGTLFLAYFIIELWY
jgi:hypothetical protein